MVTERCPLSLAYLMEQGACSDLVSLYECDSNQTEYGITVSEWCDEAETREHCQEIIQAWWQQLTRTSRHWHIERYIVYLKSVRTNLEQQVKGIDLNIGELFQLLNDS